MQSIPRFGLVVPLARPISTALAQGLENLSLVEGRRGQSLD